MSPHEGEIRLVVSCLCGRSLEVVIRPCGGSPTGRHEEVNRTTSTERNQVGGWPQSFTQASKPMWVLQRAQTDASVTGPPPGPFRDTDPDGFRKTTNDKEERHDHD